MVEKDDYGYHLYINKDGRTRAYSPISKKVVSYPRLIMERYLGRPLEDIEQVHHIDGDISNNDISNLELLPFKVHNEIHSVSKYQDKYVKCPMCGVTFLWTAKSQRYFNSNKNRA